MEFTEITRVNVGENSTITLKITDENDENIEEGNITLTIKNDTYTVAIEDGIATTNITTKADYMSQILTAIYEGTPTHKNKTITQQMNLDKGNSNIKLY